MYKIVKSVGIFTIVVISLFIFNESYAREKSLWEVRNAVLTWVRYYAADAKLNVDIEKMELYNVNGKTVAYIAHLSIGGFCFCGSDDEMLPVYLYNAKGNYDSNNTALKYFLLSIANEYQTLSEKKNNNIMYTASEGTVISNRKNLWDDLISGRTLQKKQTEKSITEEPDVMRLNLTSIWDQNSPFNDQCPNPAPDNVRTLVGCTATAMAQLMYYWKWPATGSGTRQVTYAWRESNNWLTTPLSTNPNISFGNRLQWVPTNGGLLRMRGSWDESVRREAEKLNNSSNYRNALNNLWNQLTRHSQNYNINFTNSNFDWNQMNDQHFIGDNISDNEVAELCFNAGVSANMNYGLMGSGASLSEARNGLVNNFRYDPDMTNEENVDVDKMSNEIRWLRPILFRGYDGTGGHAWVIYGYDKRTDPARQFLMNLGWGLGNDSVWITLDNIQFSNDQRHLTSIAPFSGVKFVGGSIRFLGDGSPSSPYGDISLANENAPEGTTLIFRAGTTNTFLGSSIVIQKKLILKGENIVIKKFTWNGE